jgi:hypothetical protein
MIESTSSTKKVKFGRSRYKKPTPKKMRKLGDALLAVSTTISLYAITEEMKALALGAVILGAVGKFLTNFFAEEEVEEKRV